MQQLQLDSGESSKYKQCYDFAINEVNKKYNLRSKKKIEHYTNKTTKTKNNKTLEAPTTKVLQILPRENKQNSSPTPKFHPTLRLLT